MVIKFAFNSHAKAVTSHLCLVAYIVEYVTKADFYLYIFGTKEVHMKIYGRRGEENDDDKTRKFPKSKSCVRP